MCHPFELDEERVAYQRVPTSSGISPAAKSTFLREASCSIVRIFLSGNSGTYGPLHILNRQRSVKLCRTPFETDVLHAVQPPLKH